MLVQMDIMLEQMIVYNVKLHAKHVNHQNHHVHHV